MPMWELNDGVGLVRALQQSCRNYGYHLAIGGGVVNKGESDKDLDLYFLPLDNSQLAKPSPEGLIAWLSKMWGDGENIAGVDYDNPDDDIGGIGDFIYKPSPKSAYKYKIKFTRKSGDRIDVFIL